MSPSATSAVPQQREPIITRTASAEMHASFTQLGLLTASARSIADLLHAARAIDLTTWPAVHLPLKDGEALRRGCFGPGYQLPDSAEDVQVQASRFQARILATHSSGRRMASKKKLCSPMEIARVPSDPVAFGRTPSARRNVRYEPYPNQQV